MQRRIKLSHNFLWMLLTTKADERIATYKICWLSNKKVSPAHSPPKERANVINFLIKHPWRDSVSVELHSLDPAALLKMNSAWAVLRIVQHHPPIYIHIYIYVYIYIYIYIYIHIYIYIYIYDIHIIYIIYTYVIYICMIYIYNRRKL